MTDKPYEVGYGRPPTDTRFGQPGGNGRGKGRKKGAKNVSTIATEALQETIKVTLGGGRTQRVSKLQAGLMQLANKAASGDMRAIQMVIGLAQGLETKEESTAVPEIALTDADRHVLDLLVARIHGQMPTGGDHD